MKSLIRRVVYFFGLTLFLFSAGCSFCSERSYSGDVLKLREIQFVNSKGIIVGHIRASDEGFELTSDGDLGAQFKLGCDGHGAVLEMSCKKSDIALRLVASSCGYVLLEDQGKAGRGSSKTEIYVANSRATITQSAVPPDKSKSSILHLLNTAKGAGFGLQSKNARILMNTQEESNPTIELTGKDGSKTIRR